MNQKDKKCKCNGISKCQCKIDPIVESVREDLLRRSKIGIDKYGVTLDRDDLSLLEWLQHAYEECLDQSNYLKCAITKLENENKNK